MGRMGERGAVSLLLLTMGSISFVRFISSLCSSPFPTPHCLLGKSFPSTASWGLASLHPSSSVLRSLGEGRKAGQVHILPPLHTSGAETLRWGSWLREGVQAAGPSIQMSRLGLHGGCSKNLPCHQPLCRGPLGT